MSLLRRPSALPLWRDEITIDAADERYVTRRQFTKFLVLTSFGMVAGQAWIWVKALGAAPRSVWPEVVVARASEVAAGSVRFFTYPTPAEPCILIRRTNGEFTAFSRKCTHLSCAVYYAPARDRLECPCHEGYFSPATGRVLQGPPPRPLPRVALERRGDDIVAVRLAEGAEE